MCQVSQIDELFLSLKNCQNNSESLTERFYKIYQGKFPLLVRFKCAEWIEEQQWREILQWAQADRDSKEAAKRAEELYLKLCEECSKKLATMTEEKDISSWKVQQQFIEETYGADHMKLVLTMARSLTLEQEVLNLVDQLSAEKDAGECKKYSDGNIILRISSLETEINKLEDSLGAVKKAHETYDADALPLEDTIRSYKNIQNGAANHAKYFTEKLMSLKQDLFEKYEEYITVANGILHFCQAMYEVTLSKIQAWKEDQKMEYIGLKEVCGYHRVDEWCADVGMCFWKFLSIVSPTESLLRSNASKEIQTYADRMQQVHLRIREMFQNLLQESFMVVRQPERFLRVAGVKEKQDKKKKGSSPEDTSKEENILTKSGTSQIFSCSVRLLAADKIIEKNRFDVRAEFQPERDLPAEKQDRKLALINSTAQLAKHHLDDKASDVIARFDSLQVRNFIRRKTAKKTSPDNAVCERKYRLVFTVTLDRIMPFKIVLTTVSLPIVITTNVCQESDGWASLIWQCYNNDVYAKPYAFPAELPWHQVKCMLNYKFLACTGNRDLSERDLKFIFFKLTGSDQDASDHVMITWNRFAKDHMQTVKLTFWKWFHSVLNLTRDYLAEAWNDGVIHGFISKSETHQLLQPDNIPYGTFILRFSERVHESANSANPSGGLSATFKPRNINGNKMQAFNITATELKEENIGQCLKKPTDGKQQSPLKYLYGDPLQTMDAVFEKYYSRPKAEKKRHIEDDENNYITYIGKSTHIKLNCSNLNDDEDADDDGQMSIDQNPLSVESVYSHSSMSPFAVAHPSSTDDFASVSNIGSPPPNTSLSQTTNEIVLQEFQDGSYGMTSDYPESCVQPEVTEQGNNLPHFIELIPPQRRFTDPVANSDYTIMSMMSSLDPFFPQSDVDLDNICPTIPNEISGSDPHTHH